jgi:hypothetical protein
MREESLPYISFLTTIVKTFDWLEGEGMRDADERLNVTLALMGAGELALDTVLDRCSLEHGASVYAMQVQYHIGSQSRWKGTPDDYAATKP